MRNEDNLYQNVDNTAVHTVICGIHQSTVFNLYTWSPNLKRLLKYIHEDHITENIMFAIYNIMQWPWMLQMTLEIVIKWPHFMINWKQKNYHNVHWHTTVGLCFLTDGPKGNCCGDQVFGKIILDELICNFDRMVNIFFIISKYIHNMFFIYITY